MDPLLLRNIVDKLEDDSFLLTLRSVSKELKHIVESILLDRFLQRFGLQNVSTLPSSPAAYVACSLHHFARCQPLQSSHDSLSTIALRYDTELSTLRRLNNIISDHTFASRAEIFVPVKRPEDLAGMTVAFEYLSFARRWMWVVLPEDPECVRLRDRLPPKDGCSAKLIDLLARALRIDKSTAAFYLHQSGGNMKLAMKAYSQDLLWDKRMKELRKSLVKTRRHLTSG